MFKIKKLAPLNTNLDDTDLIAFDDVSYVYNPKSPYEFKALKGINWTIDTRKIIGVIGSTGSGKSTLIQHINGLIIPTSGKVQTHGFQICAKQKRIKNIKGLRRKVGLVFQFPEYQLFEETVRKDIMFGPIQLGIDKETAEMSFEKYFKLVDLPYECQDRSPFALSGGQKRRVAVAGILVMEGKTLILDEPTAGLDPKGEQDFIKLFTGLNKNEHKRIIWVSHNMDHMLEVCSRILVLHKGKILDFDTPSKIFSNNNLLETLNIQPPQVYRLMYALRNEGFDFSNANITNISELVSVIKKQVKGDA